MDEDSSVPDPWGTCILPQRNLYDDVAQCHDGSDLLCKLNDSCFKCYGWPAYHDFEAQVCDGVIDCWDLSDECLCEVNFNKAVCVEMFSFNIPSQLKCGKVNPQCQDITANLIDEAQCHTYLGLNQSNKATNLFS